MDYTSTPITATFTAGTNNTTINISVTIDDIVEESETFNLGLTISTSLNDRITLGTTSTATATITDDTSKDICVTIFQIYE